ncbi:tellurite resistance TerB C-terminal domain-containing protein [uncultured Trichococcus sp.]|uniref:tellurite resistance TerB C-terminal domain-containing protein n=1 Tax=uncultured Trichococcus sp. TaxID=189665 RepID=UPI002A18A548|nr:tellurite resistance TerB C-terminal domain-containing protein [uncultured Trichococcus sp.]
MFDFINKIFKNKRLTEEEKISIIELVNNEESFIKPRDLIAERERQKIAQKKAEKKAAGKAWISYVSPPVRLNDNFTKQIEEVVSALFERLCTVVDVELKKKHKNIKHVKYERYYYHVTAFDEIYRLSREVVCSTYRLDNVHVSVFFSYDLRTMLSRDIQKILTHELEAYRENLPFPDEETRDKFGLTQFGSKIVWWDPSGMLRDKQFFDGTEMAYFDHLRKRATRFTEVPTIMTLCLRKYADLMQIVLHDIEDGSIKWKIKPNNYFRKYFHLPLDDERIWAETVRLPADLYLLAENMIRKEVEGLRVLPAEESMQNLQKYLPIETFQRIQIYLSQKVELELDYQTVTALRNVNKTVWHEAANLLIRQSLEQVSGLLEVVAQDPDLKKIATKVIKQSEDPDKRIIFIFLMEKMALPVSKALQKERDGFIHPTRQNDYQQLLLDANLHLENLPELLNDCTQPMRREINLDTALITASHSALDTIIEMVDTYLSEDETSEGMDAALSLNLFAEMEISLAEEQSETESVVSTSVAVSAVTTEEPENPDSEQESEHMRFLKQMVASNGISLDDFKKQAKNKGKLHQAYLTELNEVLYEIFDDQVLVISQQQVIIEEDFMEEMREWIDG